MTDHFKSLSVWFQFFFSKKNPGQVPYRADMYAVAEIKSYLISVGL